MTERFAIYFAPAADSVLQRAATAWLARPELQDATVSARRYGFHATLKAPMRLAAGGDRPALASALADFAAHHRAVALRHLAPRPIEAFLALTTEPQSQALTDFAADVVRAFEPFRAPLSAAERARRLTAPLTARQSELVDLYGYPYVLEQFQFHMTLTDRLPVGRQAAVRVEAEAWFAAALAVPIQLDRLVLFREAQPGAPFERLEDFELSGGAA
jgi:hypothetical protein